MRREKQIIKESEMLIDPYEMLIDWEYERGLKEGFVKGAKWADGTMLDKACAWLENKLRMYDGYSDTADLVDSFRKAMEE